MSDQTPSEQPAEQPRFDPSAEHQLKPKLRKVRLFPLPVQTPDGEQAVAMGIADAQQVSPKVVGTNPAFQAVLGLLDGSRDLDQVAAEIGQGLTREMLEPFIAQLDEAALIEGPGFDALLAEARERFDESDILPPGASADFADALVMQATEGKATDEQKAERGAGMLGEQFDRWIDESLKEAENPSLDALPRVIIAPHLDYPRGWMNYAGIYGRLRVCERPDRVVILGTNHFGFATGVCGCDKGYATPLGECALDVELVEKLKANLGEDGAAKLFADRFDHENEHSIELHIPWVQHVFGGADGAGFPRVFAALVHDPATNNGASYDGNGLDLDPFVEALRGAIGDLPGRTLIVCSADLSHAGPLFGDQQRVFVHIEGEPDEEQQQAAKQAEAFRNSIAKHDHEMLELVKAGKAAELVGSMAWQQNPTRWCSTGALVAAMGVVEAEGVEVLHYNAAIDGGGNSMVSSVAGFVG